MARDTVTFHGDLEIDPQRGVVYFHCTDPVQLEKMRGLTLLRICRLPTPIPTDGTQLDITFGFGVSWAHPTPGASGASGEEKEGDHDTTG